MATYQEQLERVQAAIADIEENGQHLAASGGRIYTKADLKTLYDREERLMSKIRAGNSSVLDRTRSVIPYRG